MKFAALEPVIAILVAVGWFIVKAILDRRRDADEWSEMELPRQPRPAPPPLAPQERTIPQPHRPPTIPPPIRPRTQRAPQPPPVIGRPEPVKPIFILQEEEGPARPHVGRLKESQESYALAAKLQDTVANRLSAIDQQTASAKPTEPRSRTRPASAAQLLRTFRNPQTVRQAFLAQFVLNPPKALE